MPFLTLNVQIRNPGFERDCSIVATFVVVHLGSREYEPAMFLGQFFSLGERARTKPEDRGPQRCETTRAWTASPV